MTQSIQPKHETNTNIHTAQHGLYKPVQNPYIRDRNYFWRSKPGKMLITSIVGVIITFTLLGISGLIIEPVSVNAVLFSLAYSTIFTLSIDPIKFTYV